MGERTCDCGAPSYSVGLCQRCYHKAYRLGTLPPRQLELPVLRHSLSNIDVAAKRADCMICGPNVVIRVRNQKGRGRIVCRIKSRHGGHSTPEQRRAYRRKTLYKLTSEAYEAMVKKQGGRCAICDDDRERLVIDHCHKSGVVRGLLCRTCNLALGYLKDNFVAARKAASYLEQFQRDGSVDNCG